MLTQELRILNAALSMAEEANGTQRPLRHVRPGVVDTIVKRSLAITASLPPSLREHLAIRDLSDFISMSQSNKSAVLSPRNTDLLPIGHPRSSRSHALSLDSMYAHRSRWVASDCNIGSDEARALVAAAFSAVPNSMEHTYLSARLRVLPAGVVPPSVILAAIFGGGNSRAARSARARAQRRDRKGRFAWMGGGMSAYVRRSDGSRRRLSGRVVGQGVGDDDTFDIEGPDGQIRRVEARAAEGTKAYLKSADSSPEGFSPTTADSNAGDYFMNESDIRLVEAPNGFYRDDSYKDVGTRYTDDAYEVIRIEAGDSSGDAYEMMPDYLMRRDAQGRRLYQPDKPVYVVRRNGDESTDNGFQTWADVQDWINKDQNNLDKSEGREPDVLARLTPQQYDDLVENVGDGDPVEYARRELGLEKGTGTGGSTGEEGDGTGKKEEEAPRFDYVLPENAYNIDLYEPFVPRDNLDAVSSEYTEDPNELASMFEPEDLRDALEAAILSDGDGPASGMSPMEFPDGQVDSVPAEAIFDAMRIQGFDAEAEVADIYDSQMDGTPNRDALDAFNAQYGAAGDEVKARLDGGDYAFETIPYDTVSWDEDAQKMVYNSGESEIIDFAGRKMVLLDINGVKVPFYLSTGSGGKKNVKEGRWYPFFGLGDDGWINKLGEDEINNYYGSPELRAAAEWLDKTKGDLRKDESIPRVKPEGAHIDAINQDMNPANNGESDTKAQIDANIADVLARISKTSEGDKTGEVTPAPRPALSNADRRVHVLAKALGIRSPEVQSYLTERYGARLLSPSASIPQDVYDTFLDDHEGLKGDDLMAAIAEWRANPSGADKESEATLQRPLPALLEGLSDEEKAQFQKDGKYEQYLPSNREWVTPPDGQYGMYIPYVAPFERLNNALNGMRNELGLDPLDISNNHDQSDLLDALRTAISNEGPLPGTAELFLKDKNGETVSTTVPAEAIRDALQLQGFETNEFIESLYNDRLDNIMGDRGDPNAAVTPEHRAWLLDADNRVIESMHVKDLDALRQVITGMNEDQYDRTPGWASQMFQGDLIDLIDENIRKRLNNNFEVPVDSPWMSEEDLRIADDIWAVPPGNAGGPPPPPPPPPSGGGGNGDGDSNGDGARDSSSPPPPPPPPPGGGGGNVERRRERLRAQARPLLPGDEELENTPVIPLMSQWRDPLQQRARRYAALSNIVLKKFAAGWSARGRNRVRPTHEIVSRLEDPNLDGMDTRGLDLDTNYRDTNGNIIRLGDIVAHRRGGELQNPDVENVNYLVGKVVARQPYMRVDERGREVWRAGGLEIEILQSDNPDYVGKTFQYIARFSEIVEQPDLKTAALDNESADAKYKRSLWDMNDAQLFTEYGDMLRVVQQQGRRPNKRLVKLLGTISNELTTRNTFDPKHMSWLLHDLTDEALSSLGRDIGPDEGASGEVLRRLINFEWTRRQNNQNEDTFPLPASIFADLDLVPDNSMPPLRDFGQPMPGWGNFRPPTPTPTPTPTPSGDLTPAAKDLFLDYARQAANWGDTPWLSIVNNDDGLRPEQFADLDALEAKGLIAVSRKPNGQLDLEDGFLQFTQKGKDLAAANGVDVSGWFNLASPAVPAVGDSIVPTPTPIDERNIFERFVSFFRPTTRPPSVEGDPRTKGIEHPSFGTIDIDAVNPSAVQADYASLGWEDQRAAEIAEAARSRPALSTIRDLVVNADELNREVQEKQNYFDSLQGDENADQDEISNLSAELMDLNNDLANINAELSQMVSSVYGLDDLVAGEGLRFTNVRPRYDLQRRNGMPSKLRISISADNVNESGTVLGSVQRYIEIDMTGSKPTFAHNSLFTLNRGPSGVPTPNGASDAYNRWMENWYIANGVAYVDVQAEGGGDWTGAARWALNNFFWQEPATEIPYRLNLFQKKISAMPDSSAADKRHRARAQRDLDRLSALVNRGIQPSPLQFIMVGWRPGMVKNWFGYEVMRSKTWYGKKDLTPDSVSAVEAQQYADMYQVARERMRKRENAFEYNTILEDFLGKEDSYTNNGFESLAPFRDEFIPFFSDNKDGRRSLAELSPPARERLYDWASRGLMNSNIFDGIPDIFTESDVATMRRLLFQLNDEFAAYDKTPAQAGLDDTLFSKMTVQDIRGAFTSGDFITINGEKTRYKVDRQLTNNGGGGGVNEHYIIKNLDTGQRLWVKMDSGRHSESIKNEMAANMLQRMLNLRGASYMTSNDDGTMVIATQAGSGVRGATPADDMRRFRDSQEKLSLADLAGISVIDAVIGNMDRHPGNWMYIDLGPDTYPRYVPLAVDHGGSYISEYEQTGYDRTSFNTGSSYAEMALQANFGYDLLSTAKAKKLVMESAQRAVERIESSDAYDKSNPTVQIILARLKNITNWQV